MIDGLGSRRDNSRRLSSRISLPISLKEYNVSDSLSPELRAELKESLLLAIQDFFDENLAEAAAAADSATDAKVEDRRLQLATAVLMIEVARCDFDLRADEFNAVEAGAQKVLGLSADETTTIVRFAEEEVREANRLHHFTVLIDKHFNPEYKKRLIQSLWEVAYADAQVLPNEEYLIRKIAGLLHVSASDYADAKEKAREAFR